MVVWVVWCALRVPRDCCTLAVRSLVLFVLVFSVGSCLFSCGMVSPLCGAIFLCYALSVVAEVKLALPEQADDKHSIFFEDFAGASPKPSSLVVVWVSPPPPTRRCHYTQSTSDTTFRGEDRHGSSRLRFYYNISFWFWHAIFSGQYRARKRRWLESFGAMASFLFLALQGQGERVRVLLVRRDEGRVRC